MEGADVNNLKISSHGSIDGNCYFRSMKMTRTRSLQPFSDNLSHYLCHLADLKASIKYTNRRNFHLSIIYYCNFVSTLNETLKKKDTNDTFGACKRLAYTKYNWYA